MSPKSILNVDLSYLPKCTEFFFFLHLKKKNLSQILRLTGFRIEVLKTRFLVTVFYRRGAC